jgi:rfaE bifunctional protein nucleotidyltransferase chain/domain
MPSAGEAANRKIQPLDDLAAVVADLKAQGKRVVHCHGVFDLVHIGHLRHFQNARRFGDVLIVTITPDKWVNKGPHRPAFDEKLRLEMLAGFECIDYVALNKWPTAIETVKLVKPTFFVKGSEFVDRSKDVTGAVAQEEEAVKSVGGDIVFTDDITFSSSNLINRHMPQVSKDAQEFLDRFSGKYKIDDVLGCLERASTLRVLTIGETIIDEYNYCETLGKSGKEPILAVRLVSSERFAGGILAVANHAASFTSHVGLMSMLGDAASAEDFVLSKLNPCVKPTFFTMRDAPTIVKKRYIESYPFQKMFEVYLMNDDLDAAANSERFCAKLEEVLPQYDVVVVTDYGHAMIDEAVVDVLCKKAKCLAVNTQANAGNYGFNTVSKYPRADYICVSEKELRLEARTRQKDIQVIMQQTADRHGCSRMLVTRGEKGMLCWGRDEGFSRVPALAGHFTDRVGAGDAVFAVTSLCVPQQVPAETMGLIGNAVGAMAVGMVGNRGAVERTPLIRFLISLFK